MSNLSVRSLQDVQHDSHHRLRSCTLLPFRLFLCYSSNSLSSRLRAYRTLDLRLSRHSHIYHHSLLYSLHRLLHPRFILPQHLCSDTPRFILGSCHNTLGLGGTCSCQNSVSVLYVVYDSTTNCAVLTDHWADGRFWRRLHLCFPVFLCRWPACDNAG